ncbi:hypothetical protein [Thioclava sp. DLFJ4-1]|uniref:hypothetical protein n=1 Tax=Thioclava sp. DLFJ4-1 TaxID=1915313 RepID=UPI000998AE22|nr:hypothetical protein [Thioclava sp. DLFJ4-1]OOY15098.1 hypothetical protein BMI85_16255 [Thioclava sp. DLFJ4-1]
MTLHPTDLRHDISPEQSARMAEHFEALEPPPHEGFWARNKVAVLTVVGTVILSIGLLIIFDPMGHAAEVRYQQEKSQ